jgi:hypothetical protein
MMDDHFVFIYFSEHLLKRAFYTAHSTATTEMIDRCGVPGQITTYLSICTIMLIVLLARHASKRYIWTIPHYTGLSCALAYR